MYLFPSRYEHCAFRLYHLPSFSHKDYLHVNFKPEKMDCIMEALVDT